MKQCKRCGSYAVNPHNHGRKERVDLDLCDVCYWRYRAEQATDRIRDMLKADDGQAFKEARKWMDTNSPERSEP